MFISTNRTWQSIYKKEGGSELLLQMPSLFSKNNRDYSELLRSYVEDIDEDISDRPPKKDRYSDQK